MISVGIDIGIRGAVALVDTATTTVTVSDLPLLKVKIGSTLRPRVDPDALWRLMQWMAANDPAIVVIEDMERGGVRPQQSGQVALGKTGGLVEMAVVALKMRRHLVPPATWKRALRVSGDKDEARREASRLFPAFASLWSRAKDDGRAEAALLGWYGAHKVLGSHE